MDHHLAVRAILEGSVKASLYADDPASPRAVLAWKKQRLYLAGSNSNPTFNEGMRQLLNGRICPQILEAGGDVFVLYYVPNGWEDNLVGILGGKRHLKVRRQYYVFGELRSGWRGLLPNDVSLRMVDGELLESSHLKNLGALEAEMCSERASVADFQEKSFGVCLIRGHELVGWCLSEYNSSDRCEIGIEILKPYRRRGLATVVASALIEHALLAGISQIGWHCYADNAGSVATALRVGLNKEADYPVFVGWIDAVDNQAVHGNGGF
jgi:GNAT superfamily N-acetyltransferase